MYATPSLEEGRYEHVKNKKNKLLKSSQEKAHFGKEEQWARYGDLGIL